MVKGIRWPPPAGHITSAHAQSVHACSACWVLSHSTVQFRGLSELQGGAGPCRYKSKDIYRARDQEI